MMLLLARESWIDWKNSSYNRISTVPVLWNTKRSFKSKSDIFRGIELKRKEKLTHLEKIELTHLF